MIEDESFWKYEVEAPLMSRNAGFVTRDNVSEVKKRAEAWARTILSKHPIELKEWKETCSQKESNRIFLLDAQRTFQTLKNRKDLVETLCTIFEEIQDYHQGMCFIVSFFLLFLKKAEVARIIISLNKHYIPGYFRAAPVAYVRDAKTYEKILETLHPEIHTHIKNLVPAEAYCSKWFVGFNVHVLPFAALANYLDCLFDYGEKFLFQYAVSLVNTTRNDLLATCDIGKVLAILRLDAQEYPDEKTSSSESKVNGSFFLKIVEDARDVDLGLVDIPEIRNIVSKEMDRTEAIRKEREQQLDFDSDEEIKFSDEEEINENENENPSIITEESRSGAKHQDYAKGVLSSLKRVSIREE